MMCLLIVVNVFVSIVSNLDLAQGMSRRKFLRDFALAEGRSERQAWKKTIFKKKEGLASLSRWWRRAGREKTDEGSYPSHRYCCGWKGGMMRQTISTLALIDRLQLRRTVSTQIRRQQLVSMPELWGHGK